MTNNKRSMGFTYDIDSFTHVEQINFQDDTTTCYVIVIGVASTDIHATSHLVVRISNNAIKNKKYSNLFRKKSCLNYSYL